MPAPLLGTVNVPTPARRTDTLCALTTIDDRGRLGDTSILRAMRWLPGEAITVTVLPDAACVQVVRGGRDLLLVNGRLRLPVPVRRGLDLRAGDRLLILAHLEDDLVVAYTMAALEAMSARYHRDLAGGWPA